MTSPDLPTGPASPASATLLQPAVGHPTGSGADPSRRPPLARTVTPFGNQALASLYQHRLLTAVQLTRLLRPGINPLSRYVRRQLMDLRARGLADCVTRRRAHEAVWFLTSHGATLVEASGEVRPRTYRMSVDRAAGPLQDHTLAVNDTGLAFVETARRLGHDCGPLDWIPEPAHHLGEPTSGDNLLPDALLSYLAIDAASRQRTQLQFFLEIDRATMTVGRLAAKLSHYARYYDHTPPGRSSAAGIPQAWRSRYPRFPRILIVLTGLTEPALDLRALDLAAHVRQLPQLRRHRDRFEAGVTTLRRLQSQGPFAPIFMPLSRDDNGMVTALLDPAAPSPAA